MHPRAREPGEHQSPETFPNLLVGYLQVTTRAAIYEASDKTRLQCFRAGLVSIEVTQIDRFPFEKGNLSIFVILLNCQRSEAVSSFGMERIGIEPMTYGLQSRRSPS